ncbi:hypothetical protein CORT_0D01070 [Candida orthopsilosis Co 90-125]|uniref:Uncharacterized protein n=1 Tax=Candida orthopsilosis (strain 90-125) TaxID=1136231 RepID=H8X4L3_CANO9|nr:hypothetical protein CORT_0D01070 [Candida orthopsilosis Co 90-125]CCG22955.1 hypothetical protein CORT_0D01070 [Candida orthopsilosis Co 90-125]
MASQYTYNKYYQHSPSMGSAQPNSIGMGSNNTASTNTSSANNTSPLNNLAYLTPPGSASNSLSSSLSSTGSSSLFGSNVSNTSSTYSFHNPRLRYYLSKSFDIEDDLEFCPEIVDHGVHSPNVKKFNPYTSTSFSPSQELPQHNIHQQSSSSGAGTNSPRVSTPRIKKALEIINPQTKMRVGSPAASQNK